MNRPHIYVIIPIFIIFLGSSIVSWQKTLLKSTENPQGRQFNGERAYQDIEYQVSLGPRIPGTSGHRQIIDWMFQELSNSGWSAEIQRGEIQGREVVNVIGKRGDGNLLNTPWIILGAHYDTRIYADQDSNPEKRNLPVPGANDGASGVAVLLELARTLPPDLDKEIWLVFFDVEDNGNIPEWDWILGSRYFVQSLQAKPDIAVIVDMIGDKDLDIYMERDSDLDITTEIWSIAAELGYSQFIPVHKYRILDDHVPFLEAGIRAINIIDFDYPYWHTTADTIDKTSAESLQAVGETLLIWLTNRAP